MSKADVLTDFCFLAGNLKETLEQIGNQVKNVCGKVDSLKESGQDEGQQALRYLKSAFKVFYNP